MKKTLLSTTAALLFGATAVFATPQSDSVAEQLKAQGYTHIEMEISETMIKVKAIRNGEAREFDVKRETGEVMNDHTRKVEPEDDTTPGVDVSESTGNDSASNDEDASSSDGSNDGGDLLGNDSEDGSHDSGSDDSGSDDSGSHDSGSDDSGSHDSGSNNESHHGNDHGSDD